jgi:hypothetical protein
MAGGGIVRTDCLDNTVSIIPPQWGARLFLIPGVSMIRGTNQGMARGCSVARNPFFDYLICEHYGKCGQHQDPHR